MKKTITISVDVEALISAQEHIPNISAYLNECLWGITKKKDIKTDNIKEKLESYDKQILDISVAKALLKEELGRQEEENALKLKEMQENEQFMRWICPVCKHQNFIESDTDRCNKCTLPTKNDSKTKIINTKEMN